MEERQTAPSSGLGCSNPAAELPEVAGAPWGPPHTGAGECPDRGTTALVRQGEKFGIVTLAMGKRSPGSSFP